MFHVRGLCSILMVALIAVAGTVGCGDRDVVTQTYATLQDAVAAGAVERGWLPRGLPRSAYEIREAHDLRSDRRWGLFNFPQEESDAFRASLGQEMSLAGETCNPPRRIEWWPLILRERLDHDQIAATGLRAYSALHDNLIFAVNWKQGRAYYWTNEP